MTVTAVDVKAVIRKNNQGLAEATALWIQLNSAGAVAVPTMDVEAVIRQNSQGADAVVAAEMLKSTPVTQQPNLLAVLFFSEPQQAPEGVLKGLGLPAPAFAPASILLPRTAKPRSSYAHPDLPAPNSCPLTENR